MPKNWCFQIVVLEKTLENPLDSKDIKPANPKGNQPWIFIGRTDVEAETPILWPADVKNWVSLQKTLTLGKIEGKRRRQWQRMRWLDSFTDPMDMNLSKLQEIVEDREAWHAAAHGVTKSWTWLGEWTTKRTIFQVYSVLLSWLQSLWCLFQEIIHLVESGHLTILWKLREM